MKAIGNRLIVKRETKPEEKKGILILVDKPKDPIGEIISVGPKVEDLAVGDKVQFNLNYSGKLMESDDKVEYFMMIPEHILCKY